MQSNLNVPKNDKMMVIILMSTIKDVAEMAGVSHGTVSNILNGAKGVSLEKVKRVEEAIKKLGYQPDANARSLKKNRTMQVGVVLPNIIDPCFSQLFTGIEKVLGENQYTSSLYITSEIPANEKRILKQAQQQRLEGLIIATCHPNNVELFDQLVKHGLKLVFVEREVEGKDYNFVGFSNSKAIYSAVSRLINLGYKTIALVVGPDEYSSEKESIKGYLEALKDYDIRAAENLIESTSANKESAFKAAFRLLQLGKVPEVIIASNIQIAEGVISAVSIYVDHAVEKPLIVSLSEDSWTSNSYPQVIRLPRQFMQAGEKAAELLLDNINHSAFHEAKSILLEPQEVLIDECLNQGGKNLNRAHRKDTIKVLMLDSSASYAISSLLNDFKKKEGVNVEIDVLNYKEIYEAIKKEALSEEYDVFSIDIPWLPKMVERGILSDLSDHITETSNSIRNLIPGILDEYAKYNDKFYALPFMYGTQVLYYRKDLFENIKIQRQFYNEYKTELKPPKTWTEFNAVARFFTREFNPESPTEFGTTLGGKNSSGAVCEFLPRKWAYGGSSFGENGNVILNSKETIRALRNYCESFKYASPGSPEHWWGEQVDEFCQGKAAMMVLFMSHATDITDRYKSKVTGKVGYDVVPGGMPLLGGWSLGINNNSRKKDLAFKFISWACCKEMAIPYTILGGSTPCVDLYRNPELVSIYPWLPKSLESFKLSRKRLLPKTSGGKVISERAYEEILGEAVYNAISNRVSPEGAIEAAALKLQELISEI